MILFQCYSHTTEEDIKNFIETHKMKKVIFHFEYNIYNSWGDSGEEEILLDDDGMIEAYDLIDTHYIHEVKVIE